MDGGGIQKAAVAGFRQPLVWLGVPLYFLNDFTDRRFDVPVGEFALLAVLAWEFLRQGTVLKDRRGWLALLLALLLALWTAALDHYHGRGFDYNFRVFIRSFVLYGLVCGYILLPAKERLVRIATGFMVGYILHFSVMCPIVLARDGLSSMWQLKMIIPTPAVVLMMLLCRGLLSKTLRLFLAGYLLYALAFIPLIGSRGAFLSLLAGFGFYLLARIKFVKRQLLIALVLLLPLLPAAVALLYFERGNPHALVNQLYAIDYATLSNIERTLMLHMNIESLMEAPLTGVGYDASFQKVEPYYVSITGQPAATGRSPHNYYMEYAVPYGLPALGLLVAVWYMLYNAIFAAVQQAGLHRSVAAFACGVTGWIMLYQPLAGNTRFDLVILLVFALYALRRREDYARPLP